MPDAHHGTNRATALLSPIPMAHSPEGRASLVRKRWLQDVFCVIVTYTHRFFLVTRLASRKAWGASSAPPVGRGMRDAAAIGTATTLLPPEEAPFRLMKAPARLGR